MSTILTKEELNSCSRDDLVSMLLSMQDRLSIMEERIAAMNVNTYGRKTEKITVNPDQMNLFNEMEAVNDGTPYDDGSTEEETAVPEETETITYTRKKQKGKREADLSKYPKVEITHELSEEELETEFGKDGWKRLPDQVYSKLEMEPAKYWVAEHHIAVYAAKNDDKIIKADHPAELLNNSIASASIVAAIMNGKYTNAMPLYRIEKEFERNDVPISRQDMANWVIRCSERYLSVIYDRMHELLKKEKVVQADETPAYVSKDGRPAGSKSEMWVYRTGELSNTAPMILYRYSKGRAADHPMEFLKGFKGYLECDGFSAYKRLNKEDDDITICCCWAHARRRFSDAVKAYGEKRPGVQDTLAYRALEKIGKIYQLDEKFKKLAPDERNKRRQTVVKPRVDAFFAWCKGHQYDTGKKDKTYEGFTYCINNERDLRMFLENGEIPIDNSATERAIRPFTVSRKTWKLIDTPSGADASAIMYSIIETAKANNIRIYDYLKYLLEQIPGHMDDNDMAFVDDLLPWSEKLPANLKKSIK